MDILQPIWIIQGHCRFSSNLLFRILDIKYLQSSDHMCDNHTEYSTIVE